MAAYRLRKVRIVPALIAGAVVGATVVAVTFNLPYLAQAGGGGLFMVGMTFLVALVLWALGLTVVGAPLWGLAERAGLRSLHHALAMGLAATFVAAALLMFLMDSGMVSLSEGGRDLIQNGRRTPYGLWVLIRDSGKFSLLGALVAAVIWRIAYGREVMP